MRTVVIGDCAPTSVFDASDPTALSEIQLEAAIARAMPCVYPQYDYFVFTGGFRLDGKVYRPDWALVAKDRSHWFVVEVEIISHSLDGHVLPQVRTFTYGEPEPDCVPMLARRLDISEGSAKTMLDFVPRRVAVIANKRLPDWEMKLSAHQVQLLTAAVLRTSVGTEAIELDGSLEVFDRSLGFGKYSAIDRSIIFSSETAIPRGEVQISDPDGVSGFWTVRDQDGSAWVTKNVGSPNIPDSSWVQLILAVGGRLAIRQPMQR